MPALFTRMSTRSKAFLVSANRRLTSACFETSAWTASGLAAGGGDVGDDAVGAALARGVVDDDRGAGGGELAGDLGADALGGSGDDGDFPGEFLVVRTWRVNSWRWGGRRESGRERTGLDD